MGRGLLSQVFESQRIKKDQMAEGVATNGTPVNLEDNTPSIDSLPPPEYPGSSAMNSEGHSEASSSDVPNVEVLNSPPLYNQTTPLTSQQMQDLTDKMKREEAKKYFSLREGQFTNAIENECKEIVNVEEDGKIISSYLLTEIDHWDHEKERIVVITEKKLLLIKYNFIGLRVDDHRKIPLISCDKIQSGRFTYPKNTMMMLTGYADGNPRVLQHGVRIHFARLEPGLLQSWNPWSHDMPYISLTNHRVFDLTPDPPAHVQIKGFERALIEAINAARASEEDKRSLANFEVVEEEMPITVYLGLSAMIVNQSKLGFCKDRGNVFY